MFIRLGALNVRRQLARSLLVIMTLALAAISLTYSFSFQHITPPRVAPFLGPLTGGEILVAPVRWAGTQTSDLTGSQQYSFSRLLASGASWLDWFYPELYAHGFWVEQGARISEFFDGESLQALANFPGVAEAVPSPMLPAVIHAVGSRGVVDYPVRLLPLSQRVSEFAYAETPGDLKGQQFAGLLLNQALRTPEGAPRYQLGETVLLWIPQVGSRPEQGYSFDFAAAAHFDVPFASYLQLPTRTVAWNGPGENAWQAAPSLQMETGLFSANVAWLPDELWHQLWGRSGLEGELPLGNLVLKLADPQLLDETLVALNKAFPQFTFISLNRVEDRMMTTGSLEYFRRAPENVWQVAETTQLVMPASFNQVFGVLFLLIAGLLLGGHMLTGVAARRKEIGTLRALGARRRDVLLMGMAEVMTLTCIGITTGFFIMRLPGVIMEARGGLTVLVIVSSVLGEYGLVLGGALAVSLFFAAFPIWRLSSLAPMEVLRHD